ncbi:hypothetical protein [Candidatus Methylomirabilis sp.]|uniref:hypothetical protein n=1 Tax=Candidatus Methylomirabilis sp. TaxID=2032687 RepID=UPI003075FD6C
MADIAEKSGSFTAERHCDALGQEGFDVVNLRFTKPSPHSGLGGQLIVRPDAKNGTVEVEIRAERWSPNDPPSYETYCTAAKELIAPLLSSYNRQSHTRHRMTIFTKERLEPKLQPQSAKLFKRFTVLANTSSLHPLDWRRFYEFVRDSRSRLCEEDLARLLIKDGFPEQYAWHIAEIYGHLYEFKRLR